ncbi:MAG: FRG domain-containing protein [Planctomycetes bacterium]|nr:FRG domain-containing protein [Planctomycetota bacterium]
MAAKKTKRPTPSSEAASSRILEHRVSSWSEFVDIVGGWDGFRSWGFRGQSDARWKLQSSLRRHIEVSRVCAAAWTLQETRIRRIFERKSHLYVADPPSSDELEWLALMQHHGAPTRLLDFTWSPYVAAHFALERATANAVVWAMNLPLLWDIHSRHRIDGVDVTRAQPRDRKWFERYYLPNKHRFLWQGDPFRMPQRVIAQSGTFLVSSHLGFDIEDIVESYPGKGTLLVKLELDTQKMRRQAMAALYTMNITQATLFPGLDGLARSMAYEFEYSWQVDLSTNRELDALAKPQIPGALIQKLKSRGDAK